MADRRKRKPGVPKTVVGKRGTYLIGDTLGKGGFGIVKLAVHADTGESYAAKVIDMCIAKRDNLLEYADREIRLAKRLDHPHIIGLIEVVELQENNMRVYIMELAPNGELFDQIVAVSRFPESTARRYFQQLIAAVRYCHQQGVVHRDLKAENLLLSKDNTLKICDFGLSRYAREEGFGDHPIMFTSIAGSLDYQAPEIVSNYKYHGQPADIWACGVILGFMLSGWLPFQDRAGDSETKARILKNPPEFTLHAEISQGARDLIKLCLNPDPAERVTADDIIRHPWFMNGLDTTMCKKLKIPYSIISRDVPMSPSSPTVSHIAEEDAITSHRFDAVDKSLLRHLRIAFDSIDTDKSGVIKEEELRDVLIKLNNISGETWIPTHDEVQTLLSFFVPEGKVQDQGITFPEFVIGYVENKVETVCTLGQKLKLKDLLEQFGSTQTFDLGKFDHEYVQKLRDAFRQIDEDKSGVIHKDELKNLLDRAGINTEEGDLNDLFNYMDVGKQDFITFEEFASAWITPKAEGTPNANLMSRIRKCNELISLSEADDARRALFQASNGCTIKGCEEEACKTAQSVFKSVEKGKAFKCYIEETSPREFFLRFADTAGVVQCEASVLIAPCVTGYSRYVKRKNNWGK